jgi:hypothetical protein
VIRQEETNAVRVVMKINIKRKEDNDKKNRWLDTIENDIRAVVIWVGDSKNRDEFR